MYNLADKLFPICRSLTGKGVRDTLNIMKDVIPEMTINSVRTGTKVFDWKVPEEWVITTAYIEDENGNRIIDFKNDNLHVVGYSIAVDKYVDLAELNEHLFSLPEQPDAIPYITSYYDKIWGFCMTNNQRLSLTPQKYHVVIESEHIDGVLNYGEIYFEGTEKKEIFLSTYICHPSMANNELSGPVVTLALAKEIQQMTDRRYSYRLIFIPETIGAITYLSENDRYKELKENVIAGFQVTCVGDDRTYSFIPSRKGHTLADEVGLYVLDNYVDNYKRYSFLDRGSDERQWCSPGIDLPVISLIRSKYGTYPEYHTSLDNMTLISPKGLEGAFECIKKCIQILELNFTYKPSILCEPQMGKRGLYPMISTKDTKRQVKAIMNLIAYCDGKTDLLQIARTIAEDFFECARLAGTLCEKNILEKTEEDSKS